MPAALIDGTAVAARVRREVADRVRRYRERTGHTPGLATVLVGDDPASVVYVGRKRKLAVEAGMTDHHRHLPGDGTGTSIAAAITPVPGGVGPMTIAMLLSNTVDAAEGRAGTANRTDKPGNE